MPITAKRRKARKEAEATLARLQDLAKEQADRLGPYADQARDQAAIKLLQARGWTAPRLETAALRVEDTVAPRVAELLTTAAQRIDPSPGRRGLRLFRRGNRRIPRGALIGGAAVVGGVIVYSLIRMRQASQDAEWQEHLDQAREQVRETRENLEEKAGDVADSAAETAKATKAKAKEKVRAATAESRAKDNGRSGS
ncbi:hypothetical protein [Nocardiopsis metallicus]|uniref:ElaB/YqjD/DUF883 family membrane-anchored ribosome-binding protein n=1 Tax=Nocardiopsis metallicus TaxID=179819 RepID=A0A840WCJ5_9ACTN|nr:hypothetical protein [Nocardiopsis metallicus]MBB5493864.1 ElaB/YqjD/DUF883 family membrane-anchored ribosome-binding protein [Nocardiopsis metallicus]